MKVCKSIWPKPNTFKGNSRFKPVIQTLTFLSRKSIYCGTLMVFIVYTDLWTINTTINSLKIIKYKSETSQEYGIKLHEVAKYESKF